MINYQDAIKKINKLKDFNINVDIGVIDEQTSQLIKSSLAINEDTGSGHGNRGSRVILFGKKNEFEEYNDRNTNVINKWLELRLKVKDKLLSVLNTRNRIAEYSNKPRLEFIKYLLSLLPFFSIRLGRCAWLSWRNEED